MEDLPIYEVSIDPEYQEGENELGWTETAFTSDPAIFVKGVAFKSQKKKQLFADEKKYRITAPAMIPMDIYRADDDGEYEVRFTPEVIEKLHVKFMQNLKNNDIFNVEHNEADRAPAFILESWIVENPKEDKAYSSFGIEVPKGTLMLTAQITDKDFYNDIVEKEAFGFSIEAFLALKEPSDFKATETDLCSQTSNQTPNNMNLPNGKFTAEDGKVYEVKDGVVTELEFEVDEEVVESVAEVTDETETTAEAPVVESVEVAMEDDKEEEAEMMDEPKEEEMAVDPEMDAEAILMIVKPLLDEIYQEIATLKGELDENAEEAPAEESEEEMSNSASLGFKRMLKHFSNQQ